MVLTTLNVDAALDTRKIRLVTALARGRNNSLHAKNPRLGLISCSRHAMKCFGHEPGILIQDFPVEYILSARRQRLMWWVP